MRKLLISATAIVLGLGWGASAQTLPTVYDPEAVVMALSDNGRYALSATAGDTDVDNPHGAGGTLIDLTDYSDRKITSPYNWAEVNDVADDGTVVGSESGQPAVWSPATGQWTKYSVPAPWGGGCFMAVTPDARYAVGYFSDAENIFNVTPMYFDLATGESRALPNLPKKDLSGEDQNQNLFYCISPDGRYALGQMSQSYLMPVALFSYVYDTANDTWRPIGYDYNDATGTFTPRRSDLHFVHSQSLSCDGHWVTGNAYLVHNGGEWDGGDEGFYPYRYNIDTDVFEVYDSDSDKEVGANRITADGVVLGAIPMGNPYPTAVVRCGNFFISLDQIFQQVYGVTKRQLIHDDCTGTFQALSADGLTAVMRTYDNCYIITMPESFVDAAAKVNLLANYSVNIPDGATISKLSEIQITFDRAISCMNLPSGVKLLDAEGNAVRSASGFTVSQSNDHKLVVTFRPYTLTPGATYYVDIPAEYIWLKDDASVKSANIRIKYVGRSDGAVQVLSITPADGSTLAQMNVSADFVTVHFDTPVAIADEASAVLYNADDNTVVAPLIATADGSYATFRPATTYYLYKGSSYRVEIAAGSVTDLSGAGGCEAITLNYHGAYVRELSNDDIYIYNNPCEDYDNFIFWEGDFNTPAPTPASWGFEYNTPWILVRDSEESTDQALAAHSMFSPAGTSDDWLVTPQLFIPDAGTYLAFDAQSYMSAKDDVLKVYVYADDAVYNYFSDNLCAEFRANADCVVDQVISAGEHDETMEGEWTHITVPLDKYAGKNIYIAFVNNNTDKSALFLNNIQVVRKMDFLVTNRTPATVVNADAATVSGIIAANSEVDVYNGIRVSLLDGEGDVITSIDEPNARLAYGDTFDFTFDNALPLTPGESTAYSLQIKSGEVEMTYGYTVKDLLFEPYKRVVIEEFTGATCGNCPQGIRALDNLTALYGDKIVPVAIRAYGSDMYATGVTGYASFLGLNAAPSARVDRGEILYPMIQNGSEGYAFFGRDIVTSDGSSSYLWGDAVQDILSQPTEASIDLTVSYNSDTRAIEVPCDVRFAMNTTGRSISVMGVVIENNLPSPQLNYFSTSTDPIFGEWGQGGMYGQTNTFFLAQDVARFVINGTAYNGTTLTDADFVAGRDYSVTLSATVPSSRLANPTNCEVVVMLIDGATGRVINANRAPLVDSGINDVTTDSAPVYYNLQGVKVQHPRRGQIYIRIADGKAEKVY